MKDFWLGSFVNVKPSAIAPDDRDSVRAQVVAVRGDVLTLRYADGAHRPISASAVVMESDQTTPVWPPVAP